MFDGWRGFRGSLYGDEPLVLLGAVILLYQGALGTFQSGPLFDF